MEVVARMPEATKDIHDSPDLESRVSALIDEMTATTQRIAALNDQVPANGAAIGQEPAPVEEAASLAGAVAELAEEAGRTAVPGPAVRSIPGRPPADPITPPPPAAQPAAPAPAAALSPQAPGDDELAKAVEKLLDESSPKGVRAATPGAVPHKIESVDASLADRADDLIAGEFADEASALKEPSPAEAGAPTTSGARAGARPPLESPARPAPAAPAPETAPAAPTPSLLPAPAQPAPPAAPGPPAPPTAVARAGLVRATARPALLRALSAVSAPLSGRPQLRDIVGWIALVQAFMALCVWMYVLFFRSATPPEPAPAKEGHSEKSGAAKPGGHGAGGKTGGGGHGVAKAAKTPKKKPAKKDAHASAGGH